MLAAIEQKSSCINNQEKNGGNLEENAIIARAENRTANKYQGWKMMPPVGEVMGVIKDDRAHQHSIITIVSKCLQMLLNDSKCLQMSPNVSTWH